MFTCSAEDFSGGRRADERRALELRPLTKGLFVNPNAPVSLRYQDGTATVTIEREAQLNSLSAEVLSALSSAFGELHQSCLGPDAYGRARVVHLRGAGPKAFVAGADIKQMKSSSAGELAEFAALGQRVMREIESLPLPVIAVVQGFSLGGGMELALAADLIVASEVAQFGQPEVKLGLIPGFGGTQRLTARVGIGAAKRLILTGENISASEAYRIGLADYLCPPDKLEDTVAEISKQLAARSPLALAAAKRAIERFSAPVKAQGLAYELEQFLWSFGSKDAAEGLDAFVNKRRADFHGKYE